MKVAILSNRSTVRNDLLSQYPEAQIVFELVVADMSEPFIQCDNTPFHGTLSEPAKISEIPFAKNLLKIAHCFAEGVLKNTSMGEEVHILLACPIGLAYALGAAFNHSTRNVKLLILNLKNKKYEELDLSDHLATHV